MIDLAGKKNQALTCLVGGRIASRSRMLRLAAHASALLELLVMAAAGDECAVVVTTQQWQEAGPAGGVARRWDMRIKVRPWTVFAKVHVGLVGNEVATDAVYGGSAELGAAGALVTLSPTPVGGDDQFELSGTGQWQ